MNQFYNVTRHYIHTIMYCKHKNRTFSLPTKMDDGKYHQLIICTDCGQRWYKINESNLCIVS